MTARPLRAICITDTFSRLRNFHTFRRQARLLPHLHSPVPAWIEASIRRIRRSYKPHCVRKAESVKGRRKWQSVIRDGSTRRDKALNPVFLSPLEVDLELFHVGRRAETAVRPGFEVVMVQRYVAKEIDLETVARLERSALSLIVEIQRESYSPRVSNEESKANCSSSDGTPWSCVNFSGVLSESE